MSDRLSLAHAIEEAAGLERAKAEQLASAIFVAIEGNVATKADLRAEGTMLRSELTEFRGGVRADLARIDGALDRLRSQVSAMEGRVVLRLIGVMLALFGLLFVSLHYWPPHG